MSQKARKKKAKAKKITFKDKAWFVCKAPKSFNYTEIGEIIGFENNVIGRTIETLLYDFTKNYEDISLKLKFKITSVNPESQTCETVFYGHQYTNDFIRALINRGSSKIQVILNLTTKDDYVFRLTIICNTIRRARSSQQILIRKIMMEIINEFAKSLNHEKFVTGIIFHEFENQIARIAKTIYPLSNCTIVKSKLLSIPEGGEDKVAVSQDEEFDIVEVDVKRSRKSEIKRTERINVKKFAQTKSTPKSRSETEEPEISDSSESEETSEA